MAQSGFTPIQLYYSTVAAAAPTSGNLSSGELAINITDGKLFYKDNLGAVQTIATKASVTNVASISFGTTGLTPATATTGAVTVAGTLAVANGGTGITAFGTGVATALGQNVTGSGGIALSTSPSFTTPVLGTPTSGTLTNCTGLPLTTGVTGTLPVANGGTGITSFGTGVATALGQNVTGSGGIALSTSPSFTTPVLGTPTSGTLTNCTGLPLTTGVTGTLPVANGGTGITAFGTGVATALGQSVTGSGGIVLSSSPSISSPTLTTPVLGTPSSGTLTNCTGLPVSTGITGLGTNVATALGANVGSSGAVVVNGGVLGTPSSGTLTNVTGLPVATGISGLGTNVATALAVNVGTAGAFVVNGGVLGTPSSGTLTSCTGLPLTTGVTGTLPVANGGTGITAFGTGVATALGQNVTGSGGIVLATSPSLTSPSFTTPVLGTPTSGTLTNCTGLPLSTGISGTLPVANGGTGQTTYTNGQLLIGNTTGNTLTKATLTAGTNVAITNGSGSITITAGVGAGTNSVAIGPSASSITADGVAVGSGAVAGSSGANVAIGASASAGGLDCVAVGKSASSSSQAAAFGPNASATTNATALGYSASASGTNSVALGISAAANANNSLCVRAASTNSIIGYYAFGHSSSTAGRYQRTELLLQQTTASTATTRLTSDGAAAAATNQLTLRNNSAFRPGQIDIVAYDTVAGTAAAFTITGVLIKRGANAASTALVGTPTVTQVQNDMAVAPTITVAADTTNGALGIDVASGSSNSTRYTAIIRTCEVASA